VSIEESDHEDTNYTCVDCDQKFATRKELDEHETKHQNL
jgi:DNA-directed RNA polymerase subunit RPC12/RpoP